jgi:hypothetical protein
MATRADYKIPSDHILTCRAQGVHEIVWVFRAIDYHLATPGVAALAREERIYLDQRFSDHAPLSIDYDFDL